MHNFCNDLESEVRSYCRSFPEIFSTANGYSMKTCDGKSYIDFFSGAGALNYGHNNPHMKKRIQEYIAGDGIIHSLDLFSKAKVDFLGSFNEVILKPRNFDYKIQFPNPTGTNAVEAALKLARKVTGRSTVMAFTNAFHGMTLGSLSVTGSTSKRKGAGISLDNVVRMPYENYFDMREGFDFVNILRKFFNDPSSGIDVPAAIILETIQAEGGLNVASCEWLQSIAKVAKEFGIVLIVDDIQVGCGRTGPFFSFEFADIYPDIVCLSKSISGFGLPLALVLIKPELDQWSPGEHNGTFRGNNLAFVTGREALNYWKNDDFEKDIMKKTTIINEKLKAIVANSKLKSEVRGKGFIQGIAWQDHSIAQKVSQEAFKRGLLIETSGAFDQVLKLMPPLIIDEDGLNEGLKIIENSVLQVIEKLD